MAGDDPLAQAGREALDLVDHRLGGVAVVAVGDVGVGPDRMDVARRAGRVGEVLLADEDERALGHPAAVDLALGGDDLLEGADRRARSRPGAAGSSVHGTPPSTARSTLKAPGPCR